MTGRIVLALGLSVGLLLAVATGASATPLPMPQEESKAAKQGKGKDGEKAKGAKKEKRTEERTPAEDSVRLDRRAERARALPLYSSTAPLQFTLIANYDRLSRDRDTTSRIRHPGTLVVADDQGVERRIPVELRTRGNYRLQRRNCRFVNVRVLFPDKGLKGTPFDGQESLKLGSHCQNDSRYDQYTMKEYLAYRIFNQVTDKSFRTRLASATYVDSASGKTLDTRTAIWIENDDDVAARARAQMRDVRRALFADVDQEQLDLVTLFQYAIGNTDFSLYALHNMRIGIVPGGAAIPYAYDFDFSGLVNTSYATPDPSLPIKSVRQRLYRGPCRTPEQFAPAAARFNEKREAILGLVAETPALRPGDVREVREWLEEFFRTTSDPRRVKRDILDQCQNKPGV